MISVQDLANCKCLRPAVSCLPLARHLSIGTRPENLTPLFVQIFEKFALKLIGT